ncbi:MAG: hypothetical protein GXO25_01245 [Euryarchaeota archaeon]|nr:hypothetical protein [Euryarchaeota archaeon]
MLWIIGLLVAFMGTGLVFIATWKNYSGEQKNWAIIFGILGAPGAMYTLITAMLVYKMAPSLLDYIVIPLGLTAGLVNAGRAYASGEFMQKISKNSQLRAVTLVKTIMFEPFMIYAYMIAILITQLPSEGVHIPLSHISYAMWIVSIAGMAGGLILGFSANRYEKETDIEDSKNIRGFIIKALPAHIIGALGVILAIIFLMPYMQ